MTPNRDFVLRRIVARCALTAVACLFAVLGIFGVESLGILKGHRRREFLIEPKRVALQPVDSCAFSLIVPATQFRRGLHIGDIKVTGEETDVTYRPTALVYNQNIQTTTQYLRSCSIALVFDQSGSVIGQSDPSGQRLLAANRFLDSLLPSDRVAVFSFGEPSQADSCRTVEDFRVDRDMTKAAIQSLAGKEGGGTPMYQGLITAAQSLAKEPSNRSRALVCFTDGEASDIEDAEQAKEAIKSAGTNAWFVILGSGFDINRIQTFAGETGGGIAHVNSATQLEDAFDQVAAKLRKEDRSTYQLDLVAESYGKPFANEERLTPRISVSGIVGKSLTYSVCVKRMPSDEARLPPNIGTR